MEQKGSWSGEKNSPFLVIFTDLDGTLLDKQTYSWEEAKPALLECKARSIPIVIVTSKTRVELGKIREELHLNDPFITENGGAVFFPKEKFPSPPRDAEPINNLWMWSLGTPHSTLKKALREIAIELGIRLTGFSDMNLDQVMACTGLDQDRAAQACSREYDEPFLLDNQSRDREDMLLRAALKRGLQVSKGDRFYHLHGKSDKGLAAKRLIEWYKEKKDQMLSIGIGDSPNDFPLLEVVDRPIFVGDPAILHESKANLSNLIITDIRGPKGWNKAVLDLIKTRGGNNGE